MIGFAGTVFCVGNAVMGEGNGHTDSQKYCRKKS
jgi:hypothetical protein